jgi:TonB family protein
MAHQRLFTPPTAHILNANPKLAVAQAVLIDPDLTPPNVETDRIGSPFGVDGPLSGGPGGPGGIGAGTCCGVGDGTGPSVGGEAGTSASALVSRRRPSRGPQVIEMIEPEYSDEARRARISGVVVVALEVGIDGHAHNIRILRPLGLGLDERALEAVSRWRFRPALADGRPIAWPATIEVNFRLL